MSNEQPPRPKRPEVTPGQPRDEKKRLEARPQVFRDVLEQATKFLAFGAIALVLGFAFRALWVANMDIHVATALITQTPPTAAFQAMALTLVPVLSYAGAAALYYVCAPRVVAACKDMVQEDESGRLQPRVTAFNVFCWSALGILAGSLLLWSYVLRLPGSSWLSFGIGVVGLAPAVGILIARLLPASKRVWLRATPSLFLIFAAVGTCWALMISLSSPSMWLPPEQVRTDRGDFVMYVLNKDDDRLVAFIPANRAVLQIPSSEVQARQFCSPGFQLTVAWKVLGQPQMQSCYYEKDDIYPVELRNATPELLQKVPARLP